MWLWSINSQEVCRYFLLYKHNHCSQNSYQPKTDSLSDPSCTYSKIFALSQQILFCVMLTLKTQYDSASTKYVMLHTGRRKKKKYHFLHLERQLQDLRLSEGTFVICPTCKLCLSKSHWQEVAAWKTCPAKEASFLDYLD
jgi:hypothetical protein